jgi:tRNA dimethylallyltransferase
LVLVGPTASGKTAVSLHLARRLQGEILSADSRQIYRYLTIGTAKPGAEERREIRHHFVDTLPPDEEFNAGEFGIRGRVVIEDIFRRGGLPITVGGSGLYVRSLIDGFFDGPGADPEFRSVMERRLADGQIGGLIEELHAVDPEAAAKADPTKPRRVIRALEVYHRTGRRISDLHREQKAEITFTPIFFGLTMRRSLLYQRIESRCDEMLRAGLLHEVELLERKGYNRAHNALNTVGYAEALAYRAGEISYEEMVRLFKQNSRRYAKRQLTWFRRDRRIRWIDVEGKDSGEVAAEIVRTYAKTRKQKVG